ncbi:TPA: hypothetical protein ACG354_000191 [Escherichia coli]
MPYAVVDSATLHNLKEAPEPSGRLSRLPVQTSANTGSQNIATEARVLTRYVLLLRQPAGLNLHHAGIIPVSQHLLTFSAFYLTGCALHLLPRDRKTAPDDKFSDTAPVPVCHFNRAKRESDARKPFRPAPENSTAPAHGWILTPPFQAIYP